MVFDKWNECSLGELANLKYGKTIRKKELSDDGYPVFSGYAIVGYLPTFDYEEPQLIIVCRGVGGTGDIKLSPAKSSITNLSIIIDSDPSKIDKSFLYWYLKHADTHSLRTGSAQPQIVIKDLEKFKIKIPPMSEQKAIAHILSTLDEKIETNNQINEKLEEMAQALFKHWFVDFEFPNENGKPYKSSGGEMVESELGMIPKGWGVGKLGDIISISSGKRPKEKQADSSEKYPFPIVGASSIMGYTSDFNYNEPVLIIGRVGTHGIIQRFTNKVWASDNTLVIKSKYYGFTYNILKSIDYKSLNRGSTQPLITQKDIKNTTVLIPPSNVVNSYEDFYSSLFEKYRTNKVESDLLTKIRDSILPKLMSGEIRVPLDDEVLSEKN
ncbi:restriction endonuclease subunit S [Aeribacillus composti]|uniref:restriction endonuclease subunit S n=1 Tax=Aeribacillus composti TaxID=1868734 RepID=UPI002E240EFF|nr:restriction endonuclease subunit S [Aeribacillus composti]